MWDESYEDKKSKAKRTVSGVITVEMTYIVPMIFFYFCNDHIHRILLS
mgnify:CR=1 FL=1